MMQTVCPVDYFIIRCIRHLAAIVNYKKENIPILATLIEKWGIILIIYKDKENTACNVTLLVVIGRRSSSSDDCYSCTGTFLWTKILYENFAQILTMKPYYDRC